MKYISMFIIFLLLIIGCSKKEIPKLSLYNTQAFAYDTGSGWEVNSTIRVKGFNQTQENGLFKASFAYEISLVTPKNDTIKGLISKVIDKSEKEKMTDTQLETQFDLDSTYADGKYKIIWNVKDVPGDNVSTAAADFDLSNE